MSEKHKDGLANMGIGIIAALLPFKFTALLVATTFILAGCFQFFRGKNP